MPRVIIVRSRPACWRFAIHAGRQAMTVRHPMVSGNASGFCGGLIGARAACAAIGSHARLTRAGQWVAILTCLAFQAAHGLPELGRCWRLCYGQRRGSRQTKKGRLQEPPLTGCTDGFQLRRLRAKPAPSKPSPRRASDPGSGTWNGVAVIRIEKAFVVLEASAVSKPRQPAAAPALAQA